MFPIVSLDYAKRCKNHEDAPCTSLHRNIEGSSQGTAEYVSKSYKDAPTSYKQPQHITYWYMNISMDNHCVYIIVYICILHLYITLIIILYIYDDIAIQSIHIEEACHSPNPQWHQLVPGCLGLLAPNNLWTLGDKATELKKQLAENELTTWAEELGL